MNTELYQKFKAIDVKKLTEEDKTDLLKIFQVIDNSLIRDWISFIFADLKYDRSVPFMLQKINSPEQANNTSSLMLSLKDLNTTDFFLDIVKALTLNGYESRQIAYEIILNNVSRVSKSNKTDALAILKSYADDHSQEENFIYIEQTIKVLTN